MTIIGLSSNDIIGILRSYSDDIDKILILFDDHGWIAYKNKESAQELLKGLKELLRNDYHRRDTKEGQQKMSEVEKTFFFPAIHKALTRIHVKTNSQPSEKWFLELLDAQSEIRYYSNELEGMIKKTENKANTADPKFV